MSYHLVSQQNAKNKIIYHLGGEKELSSRTWLTCAVPTAQTSI